MCIFPKQQSDLHVPIFHVNRNTMDIVKYYKYLGFNLSDDMRDDIYINRQIRGLYTSGNMIIKCFKHCSDPVKIPLFKSYCTSLYCSQLWSNFSKPVFRKPHLIEFLESHVTRSYGFSFASYVRSRC